ncbi:hypothetical protein INT45_006754 [Circinella minor]|uniref:Xylanolytic transcriptional activator regulatory domain-containing protein n=1 Tax=Circinella minor TaxID=1195481 RepID=A0A8H7S688_9FUNG|nr:hypothetical protein INT45_006754 [Circinella minor]
MKIKNRLKKVKCDFVHPTCGRCRGAKATCSYTGAPTQIDLFSLMQLNDTVSQLQARIAVIENGIEQVHDDTQYIAKEIKNKKMMKKKHIFPTTAGVTTTTSCNYDNAEAPTTASSSTYATMQQQQQKPNWAVSLTPNGLRIDTNIISLNDLYDILLSGLSQLRTMTTSDNTPSTPINTNPKGTATSTPIPSLSPSASIATQTTNVSSTTGESVMAKHENDHYYRHDHGEDEEDGLNAVVIKHNPLYKSKDIIFPLYSAWESGSNHSHISNSESHTSSRTSPSTLGGSSTCCIARTLPHPELLDQLLKIYEECFLCLPLPDMDNFLQQCKQQTISPLLINAVLSWSARHAAIYHGILGQQDPNRVGEPYFAAAKALLREAFLIPRIETVHALLLMYIYSIGKTGADRCESEAYTLLGLATRMALDLGLHRAGPHEEKGRRLFAALEFLETLCAAHSDKPMLFPQQAETIQLLEHEQQGERRFRIEFTIHRHKINQIYRRIHASCHQTDPLFKTVSNLERELKDWYKQLPWYFQYSQQQQHHYHQQQHNRSSTTTETSSPWTSTSFREQACLKLNFEYHFQMCQLYSIFLPNNSDKEHTVNLLSLRLCLHSADAITELLGCWAQLQQSWCHFTLDTIVMACLVYGHQLKSNKTEIFTHAKRQMQRIAALLEAAPVKHHKYVRTLITRIEKQTSPLLSPNDHEENADEEVLVSSSSSSSSIWHEQQQGQEQGQEQEQGQQHQQHPSRTPTTTTNDPMQPLPLPLPPQQQPLVMGPPPPTTTNVSTSASLEEDWSWLKPTDLAVNDLFRFADFIYTPTMDMMGYQWPPI